MPDKTIHYYNTNYQGLLQKYNNVDMNNFYQILDQYIQPNMDILEIGFGSGRDMLHYLDKGINITGIDASSAFVESFKSSYPEYSDRVLLSKFPDNLKIKNHNFDIIYSIATWMHIPKNSYIEAISSIKKLLKNKGLFIISYSTNKRDSDPRFFENIDYTELVVLFENANFKLLSSYAQPDALKRKIKWITQVFQLQ